MKLRGLTDEIRLRVTGPKAIIPEKLDLYFDKKKTWYELFRENNIMLCDEDDMIIGCSRNIRLATLDEKIELFVEKFQSRRDPCVAILKNNQRRKTNALRRSQRARRNVHPSITIPNGSEPRGSAYNFPTAFNSTPLTRSQRRKSTQSTTSYSPQVELNATSDNSLNHGMYDFINEREDMSEDELNDDFARGRAVVKTEPSASEDDDERPSLSSSDSHEGDEWDQPMSEANDNVSVHTSASNEEAELQREGIQIEDAKTFATASLGRFSNNFILRARMEYRKLKADNAWDNVVKRSPLICYIISEMLETCKSQRCSCNVTI